mgnify:CR=1 FL=1|jgi:hypothetical protein
MSNAASTEDFVTAIQGRTNEVLMGQYDMFNDHREALSHKLGMNLISGSDAKKLEVLTNKINIMRIEIVKRMTEGDAR